MKKMRTIILAAMLMGSVGLWAQKCGRIPIAQGGEMYYEQYGQGTPLLLLHGHSLDRRMWQPQIEEFSKHYRVIVPDMRGYGLSSPMSESLHTTHLDDVLTLMDSLHIDRAHVVGLSMGGFITGDMLGMAPQRMLSCTMCSGAIRSRHPSVNEPMDSVELKKEMDKIAANLARGIASVRHEWTEGLITHGGSHAELMRPALTAIINDWDGWQLTHVEPHLYYGHEAMDSLRSRRPAVPVMYLSGETEHKKHMSFLDLLPNTHQEEIPDCGHISNMERPDLFNRLILDFLEYAAKVTVPCDSGSSETTLSPRVRAVQISR